MRRGRVDRLLGLRRVGKIDAAELDPLGVACFARPRDPRRPRARRGSADSATTLPSAPEAPVTTTTFPSMTVSPVQDKVDAAH